MINKLKFWYYRWQCRRLKNPMFPGPFPHKEDGTRLTELELYKLILYMNKMKKKGKIRVGKRQPVCSVSIEECINVAREELKKNGRREG